MHQQSPLAVGLLLLFCSLQLGHWAHVHGHLAAPGEGRVVAQEQTLHADAELAHHCLWCEVQAPLALLPKPLELTPPRLTAPLAAVVLFLPFFVASLAFAGLLKRGPPAFLRCA